MIQKQQNDMVPNQMKEELRKRILYLHSRGLSIYGIDTKLHHKLKPWKIKEVIEEEIREDFNSLFQS